MAVDIGGDFGQGGGFSDGGDGPGGEAEVAFGWGGEHGGEVLRHVVVRGDLAGGFQVEIGAAEQIVGDDKAVVVVDDADEATALGGRVVDGVVEDLAVLKRRLTRVLEAVEVAEKALAPKGREAVDLAERLKGAASELSKSAATSA